MFKKVVFSNLKDIARRRANVGHSKAKDLDILSPPFTFSPLTVVVNVPPQSLSIDLEA